MCLLTLIVLAFPAVAAADSADADLVQLQRVATQWWAGYGLTVDQPYAAGGYAVQPGCGDTVSVLRTTELPALGDVDYPHGCVIRLNDTLVRAALAGGRRTAWLNQQFVSAGLRPRGRYAARELLCAVVVHEYGHVLGLPHTPTGIMQDKAPAPPPACVRWATRP